MRVWRVGSKPVTEACLSPRHIRQARTPARWDEAETRRAAFASLRTPSGDGLLAVTGDCGSCSTAPATTTRGTRTARARSGDARAHREHGRDHRRRSSKRARRRENASAATAVATNSPCSMFDPETMACTAALAGHAGAILALDTAVAGGEALVSREAETTPCGSGTRGPPSPAGRATAAAARKGHLVVGRGRRARRRGRGGRVRATRNAPLALSGGADKVARVGTSPPRSKRRRAPRTASFVSSRARPCHRATSPETARDRAERGVRRDVLGDRTARLWRLPGLVPAGRAAGTSASGRFVFANRPRRHRRPAQGDQAVDRGPERGRVGATCLRMKGTPPPCWRSSSSRRARSSPRGTGCSCWGAAPAPVATLDAHGKQGGRGVRRRRRARGDRRRGREAHAVARRRACGRGGGGGALGKQTGAAQALSNAPPAATWRRAAGAKLNHPPRAARINAMLADPEFSRARRARGSVEAGAAPPSQRDQEWNANARHCGARKCIPAAAAKLAG